MTRVYFVRHAQPDYRHADDRTRPLTAEGREDAKQVLAFFRDKAVDSFYCSPYRRSLDTILETAGHFGKPVWEDIRLRERESAPGGNCLELFQRRWADFDFHEPGGEALRSVQERNIAALLDILEANCGKTVVVGTHGTALSVILNYFDPAYGCGSFLRMIDWMPFIVELDFDGTRFLSRREHIHIEKIFNP